MQQRACSAVVGVFACRLRATGYGRRVGVALRILDEAGCEIGLDPGEAESLFDLACGFDAATVSACPRCRSRVLATVALVDVVDASPPHARARDLVDLADDAPTLHLFVVDEGAECSHAGWRDPLFVEWADAVGHAGAQPRH